MTADELRDLPDDELDALAFSTKWRWAVRLLGIGMVVAIMAIVGLYFLRSADNAAAVERANAASISEDYTRCNAANDSRAALRAMVDKIAPETPAASLDEIPEDLRPLAVRQYQANREFRAQWLPNFAPRDCEAERVAAVARRLVDPTTTR